LPIVLPAFHGLSLQRVCTCRGIFLETVGAALYGLRAVQFCVYDSTRRWEFFFFNGGSQIYSRRLTAKLLSDFLFLSVTGHRSMRWGSDMPCPAQFCSEPPRVELVQPRTLLHYLFHRQQRNRTFDGTFERGHLYGTCVLNGWCSCWAQFCA